MLVKEEHHNEAFKLLNSPRNFFKHADKDADATIQFGGFEHTASIIFITCQNFRIVFDRVPSAASVYTMWYLMLHPTFISEDSLLRKTMVEQDVPHNMLESHGLEFMISLGYETLITKCPELFPKRFL